MKNFKNRTHHFLLPSDKMPDPRFSDALIYICRHGKDGAWGFIVNQPLPTASVGALLQEMDLPASQKAMKIPAMNGGVMRPEAGFVLHTGLPSFASSFAVSDGVNLTTSKDVLQLIAQDGLPNFMLCMGFCSWRGGQLEEELANGDWLLCPADLEILFRSKFEDRLGLAYAKLGISKDRFTASTGYA